MINIHCERLPDYQNAQSIIWPVYNNESTTGLTIHQINRKIDTGNILHQETYPIQFRASLEQTVRENIKHTYAKVPAAMRYVCENYLQLKDNARPQGHVKSYTTPTIWQFMRMVRNNRKLHRDRDTGNT
jgi:methionyl-tRNA formyltransferase